MTERSKATKAFGNLWRRLETEALDRVLMQCVCAEKRRYKAMSDYEKFSAFCAYRHLCAGSLAEEEFCQRWAHVLGNSVALPPLFAFEGERNSVWRKANRLLNSTVSEDWEDADKPILCDEKQKIGSEDAFYAECDEFCQNASGFLCLNDHLCNAGAKHDSDLTESLFLSDHCVLFADASEYAFVRPNPYLAELARKQLLSGENYKKEEKTILLYHMIISALERIKRGNLQSKVCVFFSSADSSAQAFLDYVALRGLGRGLMLALGTGEDAARVTAHPLCAEEPCALSIAFWQPETAGEAEAEKNAAEVLSCVPVGMLLKNAFWLERAAKSETAARCLSVLRSHWVRLLSDRRK